MLVVQMLPQQLGFNHLETLDADPVVALVGGDPVLLPVVRVQIALGKLLLASRAPWTVFTKLFLIFS
jgi:hypothetical protein